MYHITETVATAASAFVGFMLTNAAVVLDKESLIPVSGAKQAGAQTQKSAGNLSKF